MANLPVEVITEILSRLPMKSVLQLRSTCKWWRSLIDTTDFIQFHLSKSHTTLILRHRSHLYTVDLQSLEKPLEITHPLMCYSNNIKVLGSCNNLIYISNFVDDIVLWNPHLCKHRILPADHFNCPDSSLFAARQHYFFDLHNRTFDS
ncbi:hypothetical protein V8G54_023930 [Vigna mungo]|uniref:F-box domain-containing protein n=1 Tax=Vigna mungo TaxID=3915 RepID=A0AAQ3RSQ9_VIGMU